MPASSRNDGRDPIGLSDVVRRGDLRWDDDRSIRPFRPSDFDIFVLDLADAAIRDRVPTGILLPSGGLRASAVLAAAILVRHVAESGSPTAVVALVSRNLALRGFYRSLHIGEVRLSDFYPLQIVLENGRISTVGEQPEEYVGFPGAFRVSVNVGRVEALRSEQDGMIIEADTGPPAEIRRILARQSGSMPIIYLTANPLDPILETLEENGAVWAWSPEEITELAEGSEWGTAICADVELLRNTARTTFRIVGPDDQTGLDSRLPNLWDDLRELQHHGADLAPNQLKWSWAVTGALSQLAVPVEHFDRHARTAFRTATLGDAPERAEAFARNAVAPENRDFWEMFSIDLREAVEAARSNTKPEALAEWVEERCRGGASGLAVVRNKAAAAATVQYLRERPGIPLDWGDHVRVATFVDLQRGREAWCGESTLFSGPVPWHRAGLMAMPASQELVLLSHGPWETKRIVRQIEATASRIGELAGGRRRAKAARLLLGAEPDPQTPSVNVEPIIEHDAIPRPSAPASASEPVWNPFDVDVAEIVVTSEEGDETGGGSSERERAGHTEALVVRFSDGVGFFEPDLPVSRIRHGEEEEVAVKSVQSEDRVVLVDQGIRTDLFHLVTSRLQELPEFAGTVALVREWQARAAAAHDSNLTYQEILREMQEKGTRITTEAAISHWVHGRVHGPNDAEDIRRLGEVVGDEFLVKRWKPIGRALKTMRRHHRKMARSLARILDAASPEELEDDEYFDRRLGIHLSELAEAVSAHTVVSISDEVVTVPVRVANVLLDSNEAERVLERLSGGET